MTYNHIYYMFTMPAFTKKYGDKLKLLVVLICFSFLLIELTFLTILSPDRELDNESTGTASKNDTAENVKSINTAENAGKTMKRDKHVNSTTKADTESELENKLKKEDVDFQIQQLLAPFVNDNVGRILNIEFKTVQLAKDERNESSDILDIVFQKARHGFTVLEPKCENVQPLGRRYVYVYERYWEQLTMNTRSLMSLASQARIGGRFVVEPKVKDSTFGDTGYPFSTYYDITHMNALLKSNGYSTLVAQNDYKTECSINGNFHAILHFLYEDDKAKAFLRNKFGITNRQYDEISKETKKNGWSSCEILKPFLPPNSRVFCVDPTIIREWDGLERGILRDVRCLGIFVWRGIGFKTRTSFSEKHVNVSSKEIHLLLKPSRSILNEAEAFRKTHLSGGYIAVQVRGEKVILQHGLTRLKKCIRILVNVIKNTEKSFAMTKVFVASDMSDFGSGSWGGSLKDKLLDVYALKTIHYTLISRIGAVVYTPSADWQTPDRGAVSLVELSIIAHAQHLLTVGTGSFQEWAVAKFLEFHRDDDQKQWSLTRLCSLP